jgi:flagellar L-ring protein precursor FlgH
MRKYAFFLIFTITISFGSSLRADSLYPPEGGSSIYTEKRARRVGDVITIMIQEANQATQKASSQNQKTGTAAIGAGFNNYGYFGPGAQSFLPTNSLGVGAQSYHSGQGSSSRSSNITAQMTAKIISVLPSGNYMIEGTRYVEVNEEKQLMEVTGEIRPDDIQSDNSIQSSRIANARVKVTGTGPASETAKPGILSRILSWLGLF